MSVYEILANMLFRESNSFNGEEAYKALDAINMGFDIEDPNGAYTDSDKEASAIGTLEARYSINQVVKILNENSWPMAHGTFKSDWLGGRLVHVTFLERNPKHDMATTQDWLEQFIFGGNVAQAGVEDTIQQVNGQTIILPEQSANTKMSKILVEIY